ncbi:hypothetical protein B0H13DRAFT_1852149 [Mycena leptocephala]|nr:hypothetical protein B0H13DRAFT_1852149 [Mycena leptocephala]
MAWRDGVIAKTSNGLPAESAEATLNSLAQQMACIDSLERLCGEWTQALDIWQAHKSNQDSSVANSLQAAIQANATTRLVRDARMKYILKSLITTWRDRIPVTGAVRTCKYRMTVGIS